MAQPTSHLRFVQKDGTQVLQQWFQAEGWGREVTVRNGGYWEDVPVLPDTNAPPTDFAV